MVCVGNKKFHCFYFFYFRYAWKAISLRYCRFIKYKYKYKWKLLKKRKSTAITCHHDKEISFPSSVVALCLILSRGWCFNQFVRFYGFVHIQYQIKLGKREITNKNPKKAIFFFIGEAMKWISIFIGIVDEELVSLNCYTYILFILCSFSFRIVRTYMYFRTCANIKDSIEFYSNRM